MIVKCLDCNADLTPDEITTSKFMSIYVWGLKRCIGRCSKCQKIAWEKFYNLISDWYTPLYEETIGMD